MCFTTELLVKDVDPNHCYTVQVCAVNKLGRGPFSMAPAPVDVREGQEMLLPLDGCAPHSWNSEHRAPIPGQLRNHWVLDAAACLVALAAPAAFDMELALSFCDLRASETVLLTTSLLLSTYLVCGMLATFLVDSLEGYVPCMALVTLAKLTFIFAVAVYHLILRSEAAITIIIIIIITMTITIQLSIAIKFTTIIIIMFIITVLLNLILVLML